MEREYSVYEAKAKLSELLRRVAKRETVVITQHRRKIARVVPYVEAEDETLDERLTRLTEEGVLRSATSESRALPMDPRASSVGVLERFLRDRE